MKNSLKIYIGYSIFIILLYILAFFDIYLKGQYSVQVIAWLWIIFTVFILIKFWKLKIMKIYSILLGILTVISILPMAIPFILLVSFLFNLENVSYYPLDSNYEIKRAKYLLNKEKLYLIEQQKDYIIFEKSKSIGTIDYEEVIRTLIPQKTTEVDPNEYQITASKLISIDDHLATIQLNINNKRVQIEITVKR